MALTQSSGKPAFHIPSLDGWRAVAILIVFLSHAGYSRTIPGLFGVTIFFFISGYLITTLLRREWDRYNRIDLKQFYLRRCLRLMPPLYIVLAAFIAAVYLGITKSTFTWGSVAAQVFYFANYFSIYMPPSSMIPGTDITWSLAVEEHFYFLFPLFFIVLYSVNISPRQRVGFLWGVCAAVLAWRTYLILGTDVASHLEGGDYVPRISHATDTRLDAILFGCILGCYRNPMLEDDNGTSARLFRVWIPVAFLVVMATFLIRATWFRETLRYSLQGIALFPVFVASIRFPGHFLFRPLNWAWVRWIGTTSYGLYLIHGPLLATLEQHWPAIPRPAEVAIGLSTSLALTALLYYGVEKPIGRLRRRLERT